jgi:N-acetyl-anhydromuramyl-L-alanine amidase AmpD
MSRLASADWRPVPNKNNGGITPRMVIVHIMEGTLDGTDSLFHNPASQVSAHFGVGKDGQVYQWVDTDDMAWHAMDANAYAIGIENEGHCGEVLTKLQLASNAAIFAWANNHYPAIDMWLNRRVEGSGLSYHALGGAAWGGHPCPCPPIIGQLDDILRIAKAF